MSRLRGKSRLSSFVILPWALLNSEAYKALSPSAGKCLPFFRGKVKLPPNHADYYSTIFELSYGEAGRYGFAHQTYSRIICELIAKGFIDGQDKGGLRGSEKSSNRFCLSERWKKYGQANFEEQNWRTFQPKIR
jgi:hypothetical protein